METLEDIFKEAQKNMKKKVEARDEASRNEVDRKIQIIQQQIYDAFPRGNVPPQCRKVIEEALADLRSIVNNNNSNSMKDMRDMATMVVRRTKNRIEEARQENIPEDERTPEEQRIFTKGEGEIGEIKREVKPQRVEQILRDAVRTTIDKIANMRIGGYGYGFVELSKIEATQRGMQMGMRNYQEAFVNLFQSDIRAVEQIIEKEYDGLEQKTLENLRGELRRAEEMGQDVARQAASQFRSDTFDRTSRADTVIDSPSSRTSGLNPNILDFDPFDLSTTPSDRPAQATENSTPHQETEVSSHSLGDDPFDLSGPPAQTPENSIPHLSPEGLDGERLDVSTPAQEDTTKLGSDYLNDDPVPSWDLRNYGTSAKQVNEATKKKLQEDKDKLKEGQKEAKPEIKPLSTDYII